MFHLKSKFKLTDHQAEAAAKLERGLKARKRYQTLIGVTGSGKTFTIASVIAKINKPTLIISHNKTLAAQLYQEFKDYFPQNSVHYFVSYYDYYQPEAYIPETDTYIEKDAKINEEIDRLRHAATEALISRKDVIVVASVSCIYNLGSPENYRDLRLNLFTGQKISAEKIRENMKRLQYNQDLELKRGAFRKTRNEFEIAAVTGDKIIKIVLAGNSAQSQKIEKILVADKIDLETVVYKEPAYEKVLEVEIFPAKYWVPVDDKIDLAIVNIRAELQKHLVRLKKQGLVIEAERLRDRTESDIEMIKRMGYCHGIENYSHHLEFRKPGKPPYTLIDYFREKGDFLAIIDESHLTIPQIGGMRRGDLSRKGKLIEYGFRLPSALDNRPLTFGEFEKRIRQTIYMSATPKPFELRKSGSGGIAEQLVRPTGLLDPTIEIQPTENQIEHLLGEIKKRLAKNERVLVTTLTKRMAEDLTEYLSEQGIKVNYIHSDVKTLERIEIIHDLRLGNYDVIVGVNLLREGLDLPEVSLVAILDADKEGFLRNTTTLIQTMGRAARHINGHVIMYADKITGSMDTAIKETERRRGVQEEYNKKHGTTPASIEKEIKKSDLPSSTSKEKISRWYSYDPTDAEAEKHLTPSQRVEWLTKLMNRAIKDLRFEEALVIRNQILELKKRIDK
ncbi:MAG: excinuclease ABC subunit B [Parcubacteria group bacterium Licking1014_17]|nr:MAG: excinuclease ABC subunit B [Parcubacteria group bacterium Licking1014_17]